jgi:RNA polymerase sigma-70 factor (ECF subfamily)
MPDDSDHQILTQAAAGDTAAFRALFEAHSAALFRFACHLTSAVDAAEDVVQDCFLRLVRQPGRFDATRGSLRQYLYGMVRNLVRQRWQSEGRLLSLDDVSVEDDAADPLTDAALQAELSGAVQSAIRTLPVLQREAIVLFEFEGLSLEEIAAVAGCDPGTVKSRLYRARERLRRTLAPYGKGVSHESAER